MVKAKITMDNRKTGEIKDCDLIISIGLGGQEEYRVQVSAMGGGLEGSVVIMGLADGVAEAIDSLANDDDQAIRMLTTFTKAVKNRCEAKMLERLTNGD